MECLWLSHCSQSASEAGTRKRAGPLYSPRRSSRGQGLEASGMPAQRHDAIGIRIGQLVLLSWPSGSDSVTCQLFSGSKQKGVTLAYRGQRRLPLR